MTRALDLFGDVLGAASLFLIVIVGLYAAAAYDPAPQTQWEIQQ